MEWKDIDFENGTMRIARTAQYVGKGQYITKEPKTKSGIREFAFSKTICHLLTEYRIWQDENRRKLGDKWVETHRLFTAWNGSNIHPDTITGWFSGFIKKHDFPHVTLHSLRHTNATLMIADGTDVCTVSKRLGHANTSTTLNIYAHALKAKDTEAADKLENVLSLTI